MSSGLLNPILLDFQNDLIRIERLIILTESLKSFGDEDAFTIPEESSFIVAANQLRDDVRRSSIVFPILSGTLLLYISGRFENFIRTTFETLCDIYASKCKKFDDLPEKMRQELINYTAMVMANPKKFGFNSISSNTFIQNISNNISAETDLGQINSACLSITETNMNSDMVNKIFNRIGLTTLWTEIGKQISLKTHFETLVDNDIVLKSRKSLDDIMSIRNKIAHPSSEPEFPDANAVLQNIAFLKILAIEIVNYCIVQSMVFKGSNE
jgi:hypothetical protein